MLNIFLYVYLIADLICAAANSAEDHSDIRAIFQLLITQFSFFAMREISMMLANPIGDDGSICRCA